jgi:tryptophanyl-tRNA synthetase
MIADYHSLTTALTYDHNIISYNENVGRDSIQMAKVLLSSGIDKEKMCLFIQSQVPQHT